MLDVNGLLIPSRQPGFRTTTLQYHSESCRPLRIQRKSVSVCFLEASSGQDKTHNEDHEPDLFDYFDPLLSPHAYPDGISPDHKPQNSKQNQPSDQSTSWNPFFPSSETETTVSTTKTSSAETEGNNEEDLFEYFDPLLSPHAYPQGVSPSTKPDELQQKQQQQQTTKERKRKSCRNLADGSWIEKGS